MTLQKADARCGIRDAGRGSSAFVKLRRDWGAGVWAAMGKVPRTKLQHPEKFQTSNRAMFRLAAHLADLAVSSTMKFDDLRRYSMTYDDLR
jgi:hypothetical protein